MPSNEAEWKQDDEMMTEAQRKLIEELKKTAETAKPEDALVDFGKALEKAFVAAEGEPPAGPRVKT